MRIADLEAVEGVSFLDDPETVLANDLVRFGFERAELTDEAKKALAEFAGTLKNENRGVYIEIQGHTDATGNDEYNLQLGEERAAKLDQRRRVGSEHDDRAGGNAPRHDSGVAQDRHPSA